DSTGTRITSTALSRVQSRRSGVTESEQIRTSAVSIRVPPNLSPLQLLVAPAVGLVHEGLWISSEREFTADEGAAATRVTHDSNTLHQTKRQGRGVWAA